MIARVGNDPCPKKSSPNGCWLIELILSFSHKSRWAVQCKNRRRRHNVSNIVALTTIRSFANNGNRSSYVGLSLRSRMPTAEADQVQMSQPDLPPLDRDVRF